MLYLPSTNESIQDFKDILLHSGIEATIRREMGGDIDAACGQLAGDVKDRTRAAERMAKQRTIVLKPIT